MITVQTKSLGLLEQLGVDTSKAQPGANGTAVLDEKAFSGSRVAPRDLLVIAAGSRDQRIGADALATYASLSDAVKRAGLGDAYALSTDGLEAATAQLKKGEVPEAGPLLGKLKALERALKTLPADAGAGAVADGAIQATEAAFATLAAQASQLALQGHLVGPLLAQEQERALHDAVSQDAWANIRGLPATAVELRLSLIEAGGGIAEQGADGRWSVRSRDAELADERLVQLTKLVESVGTGVAALREARSASAGATISGAEQIPPRERLWFTLARSSLHANAPRAPHDYSPHNVRSLGDVLADGLRDVDAKMMELETRAFFEFGTKLLGHAEKSASLATRTGMRLLDLIKPPFEERQGLLKILSSYVPLEIAHHALSKDDAGSLGLAVKTLARRGALTERHQAALSAFLRELHDATAAVRGSMTSLSTPTLEKVEQHVRQPDPGFHATTAGTQALSALEAMNRRVDGLAADLERRAQRVLGALDATGTAAIANEIHPRQQATLDGVLARVREVGAGAIVIMDLDHCALDPTVRAQEALKEVGRRYGIAELATPERFNPMPGYHRDAFTAFLDEHPELRGRYPNLDWGDVGTKYDDAFFDRKEFLPTDRATRGFAKFVEDVHAAGGTFRFITGRRERDRDATLKSLEGSGIGSPELLMMPNESKRSVAEEKEIHAKSLDGQVVAIFDDSPSNLRAMGGIFPDATRVSVEIPGFTAAPDTRAARAAEGGAWISSFERALA